jgi:hypothetical protein
MTDAFDQPPPDRPLVGPSGHPFPGEHEWLDLPAPDQLRISADFVDRTMRALRCDDVVYDLRPGAEDLLTPQLLAAHAPPPASADFVERTLALLHSDRRERWAHLLARYVAPEPSTEFVARTLAALEADRSAPGGEPRRRIGPRSTWSWPLLALAAAALFWFVLRTPAQPPIELRLALGAPAAFAHARAGTPLPAVLAAARREADPHALPDGAPDGAWLLLGRDR